MQIERRAADDCAPSGRQLYIHFMREVNRSALIMQAKQPFLAWLVSVDPSDSRLTLHDVNREPPIYLIAECESDEEFYDWLKRNLQRLFEEQLGGWWTIQSAWPKNRTFEIFQQWFECRLHSVVPLLAAALASEFVTSVPESTYFLETITDSMDSRSPLVKIIYNSMHTSSFSCHPVTV